MSTPLTKKIVGVSFQPFTVINGQPRPVLHIIQPHLYKPYGSSLHFYFPLYQLQWHIQVFFLVARNPPGQYFFLNQGVDTILAPTFTSHLNLRILETPPPETNSELFIDTVVSWRRDHTTAQVSLSVLVARLLVGDLPRHWCSATHVHLSCALPVRDSLKALHFKCLQPQ